jgi:hypothetical protein
MAPPRIHLNEVTAAVQDAVRRVLAEKGLAGIDKLWVGFVAPDHLATIENAAAVAKALGSGAHGTPQVGQLTGAPAAAGQAVRPPRLCGYIHDLK